jgi:putrescine---pyruvate transaminase
VSKDSEASRHLNQVVWKKDHDHLLHPWTIFDTFREHGSTVISHGSGVHVFDLAGRQYLDGIGGLWCVNVGYGRDEIVTAMAEQARRLPFFNSFVDTTTVPAAELAAALADRAPGSLKHVFFTTGGSTAVDTAFRLIQFYQRCRGRPEKRHVISRRDAFHGSTYLTMSLGGKSGDRIPEFEYLSDGIHHVSSPNLYRRPSTLTEEEYCDVLVEELESSILKIGAGRVAAFIAEPIQGAGGVVVPPKGYQRRTWEVCRRHDVLYVSDEVVTAFGRLGYCFSSKDVFEIEPDIICAAKGLTSGYQPLGAVLFSNQIYETISAPGHGRYFAHGFTYSGHPVACAAALANIRILERERVYEHVRDVGPYFIDRLKELRKSPIVGDVRGSHFMACVESVADKETKTPFPEELDIGKRVAAHAQALGLIVRPIGALNILSPPLILTREQVDDLVAILQEAIERTARDLRKEGHLASRHGS